MIGNIALLFFSFLFICILTIYLAKVQWDIDIVDIYIIFVLLHFGFYPFIRGLYFGKDVIFDFRDANPLVIGLVFGHVLLILAIIRFVSWYFPINITNYLNVRNIIQQCSRINKYILLCTYAVLILFQIISYYKYGVKTYIMSDDFARIGKDLPYWFTSIRTIYPLLSFIVFLGLISSLLKSSGYHKYIWLILTIVFLPIITIYGRRLFLAMIVVWAILWFTENKKDIFSVKYLKIGLVLVVSFLLFSNLFQAYRDVFQKVGKVDLAKLENPFVAVINFNPTLENLRFRPGTWEFNFLVFNNQFREPGMTTKGQVTWEGIKSSIPRIFWPGKHFLWIDEVLADLYRVEKRDIDIGKNIFGVGQVDFGYFSIIIVPLIILTIIVIMGALIKMTMEYPTFLWLFSANILFYLINIEENGNEMFYMLRNIGLIFMIFGFYLVAIKIVNLRIPAKVRSL